MNQQELIRQIRALERDEKLQVFQFLARELAADSPEQSHNARDIEQFSPVFAPEGVAVLQRMLDEKQLEPLPADD